MKPLFAYEEADSEEVRLEKFSVFLVASLCTVAGVLWSLMYYLIFGWGITAALPLSFTFIVGSSLWVSHITKNHFIAVYAQIICIIYITAFIQWRIGGVFDSGFVMVWALLGPICATMFFTGKRPLFWYFLYFMNLIITVVFNDFFVQNGLLVTENIRLLFFMMNLGFASTTIFIFAVYYVSTARMERDKGNRLLLNVLPKEIAPILKASGETIADYYESASVLFADIHGSTPLFQKLEPTQAVDWLNEIFSHFDQLVDRYGVEKIRTIGDNYMVAAGVPVPRYDHAQVLSDLALDMLSFIDKTPPRYGHKLAFRIGINSGPLVAGVIGKAKFHYDVWGDTVNTASRMESHGEVGKIQVSAATYALIKDEFSCEGRGSVRVKGKKNMETWFLVSRKKA